MPLSLPLSATAIATAIPPSTSGNLLTSNGTAWTSAAPAAPTAQPTAKVYKAAGTFSYSGGNTDQVITGFTEEVDNATLWASDKATIITAGNYAVCLGLDVSNGGSSVPSGYLLCGYRVNGGSSVWLTTGQNTDRKGGSGVIGNLVATDYVEFVVNAGSAFDIAGANTSTFFAIYRIS